MVLNNNNKTIKEAIVEAIAFFDIFSFPLTAREVLLYLSIKGDYLNVQKELGHLEQSRIIECREGLYFLPGRSECVLERKKRYNYSDRKFKIALRISRYFRLIPWVKLICVANLIGQNNLRDGSDIDLFIVTEKKRLWISRFFVVLIAKLLNVRPQKGDTKDKICLSFFIDEGQINLSNIKNGDDDKYFDFWFINLFPIFSKDDVYEKLIERNEEIVHGFPNFKIRNVPDRRKLKIIENSFYKKNWELFFGSLEGVLKNIQLKIIEKNLSKQQGDKSGVLVGDNIIKLHMRDRRIDFIKRYNEKISRFKI